MGPGREDLPSRNLIKTSDLPAFREEFFQGVGTTPPQDYQEQRFLVSKTNLLLSVPS